MVIEVKSDLILTTSISMVPFIDTDIVAFLYTDLNSSIFCD